VPATAAPVVNTLADAAGANLAKSDAEKEASKDLKIDPSQSQ